MLSKHLYALRKFRAELLPASFDMGRGRLTHAQVGHQYSGVFHHEHGPPNDECKSPARGRLTRVAPPITAPAYPSSAQRRRARSSMSSVFGSWSARCWSATPSSTSAAAAAPLRRGWPSARQCACGASRETLGSRTSPSPPQGFASREGSFSSGPRLSRAPAAVTAIPQVW